MALLCQPGDARALLQRRWRRLTALHLRAAWRELITQGCCVLDHRHASWRHRCAFEHGRPRRLCTATARGDAALVDSCDSVRAGLQWSCAGISIALTLHRIMRLLVPDERLGLLRPTGHEAELLEQRLLERWGTLHRSRVRDICRLHLLGPATGTVAVKLLCCNMTGAQTFRAAARRILSLRDVCRQHGMASKGIERSLAVLRCRLSAQGL